MDISVRSVLTAGVTAVAASALVMAPSVAPPPLRDEVWGPVEMTAVSAIQEWPSVLQAASASASATTPAPNVAIPGYGTLPIVEEINDAIKTLYNWGEEWVWWAVYNVADVVSWFVPFAWIWEPQVSILYNFGETIVRSIVFNLTDWIFGPLPFFTGLGNVIGDTWNATVGLAQDEWNWLISQIPFLPLPPLFPFSATTQAASVTTAGPIGNAVIDASHALADLSNAIWDIWNPIRDSIGYGVDVTSDVLSSLSWIPFVPLANFELTETWNLIAREGNALTSFAHDLINAGDQAVADFFNLGLIAAANNAFWNTVDSVGVRGGEAIDAVVDYALDQLDYFTGIYIPHSTLYADVQSVPATTSDTTLSLSTPEGDALEAKLTVTPDAATKSAAEVPATVVDSLDAPQTVGPEAPVAPAQEPGDEDAADDVAAEPTEKADAATEKAGKAEADKAEKAAKAEADKAAKAAKEEAEKAAKDEADKAEQAAKKDSEAAQDEADADAKTGTDDSDGAAKDDSSGPAKKADTAKQDSTAKKDKAA